LAILLASTVVYARVMLEISVAAPQHFAALAAPVGVMVGASAVATAVVLLRVRRASHEMPQQKNPTELKSALVFAAAYAVVLMALSATKTYFSGQGLYVVAITSGLTDMDAITLSAARMVQLGPDQAGIPVTTGWRLIVAATMANLFFKWMLCLVVGCRALAKQVGIMFAVPAVVGDILRNAGAPEDAINPSIALSAGRADVALALAREGAVRELTALVATIDEAVRGGGPGNMVELAEQLARRDDLELALLTLQTFYRNNAVSALEADAAEASAAAARVSLIHQCATSMQQNANRQVALDALLFGLRNPR